MVSNALSQHIESASMTTTFDFEHVHVGEFMSTYNAAMVIKYSKNANCLVNKITT